MESLWETEQNYAESKQKKTKDKKHMNYYLFLMTISPVCQNRLLTRADIYTLSKVTLY